MAHRLKTRRSISVFVASCVASCCCLWSATARVRAVSSVDWPEYGGRPTEDHFSSLAEIDTRTVSRLGLKWWYDFPAMVSAIGAPIEVDGVIYAAEGFSLVHAIDARSGRLLWSYDPKVPERAGPRLREGW